MKPKTIVLVIAILAISAGLMWFLGDEKAEPGNVILISIDTCRADHLSCYGYPYKTTPNIDKFAEEAMLFENCFANIPYTLPSHITMFTGVIPPTHGVHDNAQLFASDSFVVLPDILRENDYATYGIVSSDMLSSKYGFNHGFDVYNDAFEGEASDSHDAHQRVGDKTTDLALEWLDENIDKKKFMFIHYYDPHFDYAPPAPFNRQFANPYDGEIAFTDHCIGQIIDKLKAIGQYDDSLIIVTGDHGEMLGEHGEDSHGYFIYQNVLRVPLIIKPAGHKKKIRVTDNTSLTDIMPTVLSQTGIDIPADVQGVDLSSYIEKDFSLSGRSLYSESMNATRLNGNSLLGVINGQWHYIQTTRPELYNMESDPGELTDLINKEPQRARIMQDQLREILEASVRTDLDTSVEMDAKAIESLESLGYIGGSVETDFSFDQTKEDPKDLFKYYNTIIHSHNSWWQTDADSERTNNLLNEILNERPDIPMTYKILFQNYFKLELYDKAIEVLQKKRLVFFDDIETLRDLSDVCVVSKDYATAIEVSNALSKLEPDSVEPYFILGNIYKHLRDVPMALQSYQKVLELDPANLQANVIVAEIYISTGKLKEAVGQYEQIIKLEPDYIIGHNSIAWIRATDKDPKFYDPVTALVHAQRAAELSGYGDPEILDTLAIAQSANGMFDEAIKTANDAITLCHQKELPETAIRIGKNLELFKQNKTYREQ